MSKPLGFGRPALRDDGQERQRDRRIERRGGVDEFGVLAFNLHHARGGLGVQARSVGRGRPSLVGRRPHDVGQALLEQVWRQPDEIQEGHGPEEHAREL